MYAIKYAYLVSMRLFEIITYAFTVCFIDRLNYLF